MTTRFAYVTAALLALGLALGACSTETEQATEVEQPLDPTAAPTSDQPPATSDRLPAPSPQPAIDLPDLGPAPDFTNEVWLNSDRPLNLASLRGEVVLVEFWTFG